MNTRVRGLIAFGVILFVAIVICGWIPFTLMPSAGVAVALPVITVPAEIVAPGGFFGLNLTNTLIATLVTDLIIVLFIVWAWRASNGWKNKVPNRFQAWVEMFVETFYNFCYNIGGERLRTTPMLWPIVGTIFVFLLTANLMKLFPGVESIGYVHCAHIGTAAYPRIVNGENTERSRLYVNSALNSGISTTEEMEYECYTYLEEKTGINTPYGGDDAYGHGGEAEEEGGGEAGAAEEEAPAEEHSRNPNGQIVLMVDAEEPEEEVDEAALEAQAAFDEAMAIAQEEGDTCMLALSTPEEVEMLQNTRETFHGACFPLTEEELASGLIEPYAFAVTPFLRGPATDLNVAFALAILSIVLVQAYGVYALGPAYFEKFINITALGKLGEKPMGLIDFVVGLIEIISEIGKIVSLAFRLFGNLFAGGIVLIVMSFLVAMIIPGVFVGLEIIIGTVQALVFAVLTLVFSVQAMEAHHGDDHDDEHH